MGLALGLPQISGDSLPSRILWRWWVIGITSADAFRPLAGLGSDQSIVGDQADDVVPDDSLEPSVREGADLSALIAVKR